jgi:HEPN domain-containing protein
MSQEEAIVLRDRAYAFLRNAKRLLDEGEYDLAAFNVEQFCQLLAKYKLLVKTGTYPRTHSLTRLLRELDACAPDRGLAAFVETEVLFVTRVEDTYTVARYLPRRFERQEVEQLLQFAERVKDVLEHV